MALRHAQGRAPAPSTPSKCASSTACAAEPRRRRELLSEPRADVSGNSKLESSGRGRGRGGGKERPVDQPPWPLGDFERLLLLVGDDKSLVSRGITEATIATGKVPAEMGRQAPASLSDAGAGARTVSRRLTKQQWKTIAQDMDTDYVYTWRQCRDKYKAALKENKAARARHTESIRAKEAAKREIERREIWEAEARREWRESSTRRREEAESLDARLKERFNHKVPLHVLEALEHKPDGRPTALHEYVASVWSEEAWDEETMKQFGRTWLHGYHAVPLIDTDMHYDAGAKFQSLVYLVRAAVRRWELSPANPFKGPSLDEEEGYLMLKVAAQCCARGRGRSLLHKQGSRDEQPTSLAADAGNLTRAEIELGRDHPVVIQLLTMSLGIRLSIVRRETEQSALRGTNQCAAEGVEDKTFGRCGGTAGGAPSNPTTATTIQELAEREENLDPVRYSPSLRRGRLIRDLVRDADRAEKIVTASLSESKTGLTGCGRVYADALVAHSMAFSVAGAHWALSTFMRGYKTVDSVAASLVSNAINSASTTALQRLTARHHRYTVRKLWDDENHRLHSLDETFLRKERARLRQDYRRHKKRGRPGRIKMKEAKQQLDLLQMDLDHTLGKAWHPNHAIRPPSLQTPRVGPKVVKEELPPGWYKVKKGPTMEGFCSEDCPYYFHEATGETSWTKPTFQFDETKRIRDSVSVTNEQLAIKSHSGECEELLQEEEGKTGKSAGSDDKTGQISSGRTEVDEFSMRNEEGKTGDFLCETERLNCIKPEDIEEQHRKYFSEALDTARRSCALLDEMRSPRRYKGEAAMAFVCFTAANVADSEGNAATGLEISGTDLINMAVDHMAASREFAVRAGLRWTLGYAKLCRQSANISFYRMKDGDVSDGAEFLNEAQLVYKSLGLDQDDWHVIETKERQDALVLFEGYAN